MRVACIGECMVELALEAGPQGLARVAFAGDTFNTAVYLKRAAGADMAVAYVTALGTDELSARMEAAFRAEDLETGLIERREDLVPGLYAISVDSEGERSFTYWRENSAARSLFVEPATVRPGDLAGFDLIYLSGITLAIMAPEARAALAGFLRDFRVGGGRVAFDPNYRPRLWPDRETAQEVVSAFWALNDIGLPSLDDEMALFADPDANAVAARLGAAGVTEGAIKRGPAGPVPLGWEGDLPEFALAEHIVDTTAAGDSFNGAYLAAMLAGADVPDRLLAGHKMASEVIGHPGAIMPRRRTQ